MDPGTLSRWWLVLTVPALIGGVALLAFSVILLLRTIRGQEFARLPLSATQDVDLPEAGPLSFLIDKPRFSNVQASLFRPFALSVSLEDSVGRVIDATRALAPLSIEGVGRVRTEIASLPGAEPGHYRVRVAGLAADVEHTDAFLVVARPISKFTFAVSVVAIIVSSALALGGLIASVATFVKFQSG